MQSARGRVGSGTSIALLTGNKSRVVVLGTLVRESWRWPPEGHLGAGFLSRRKEKAPLFCLQTMHSEGAMLVHRALTLKWTSECCTGCRVSPRDLGTEAVEQCLTCLGYTPGLRVSALSSIWLLQVLSLLSRSSLSALYKGFLFSQAWGFFFTCDLIRTNSFLF